MQQRPIEGALFRNRSNQILPNWRNCIFISAFLAAFCNAILFLPCDAEILKLGSLDTPAVLELGESAQEIKTDQIDEPESSHHSIPIILPSGDPIILSSADSIILDPPEELESKKIADSLQEIRDLQANLSSQAMEKVNYWSNISASVRWNEIARSLVIIHQSDPPMASRVYALVSVAQYDGMIAVMQNRYHYNRSAPGHFDPTLSLFPEMPGQSYPSEDAAIAAASAAVLAYLYPEEAVFLDDLVQEQQEAFLIAGASLPSDILAGDKLGRMVAEKVIDHARNDGSDLAVNVTPPVGPEYWQGDDPLRPLWYRVRPWTTENISHYRPGPPPSYGSLEFIDALREVRSISDTRTEEQLRISQYWADGSGTYTPPGHWNDIACDLITEHNLDELESARTLAVLNIALMDAGISCWDTKYHYWLLRPWMADPEISTPIGKPPFPSYTSGHATFSGAASTVLACIFPTQKDRLLSMADEAALSRLYGGIHYRFDNDKGLESGRMIGGMAIKMVMKEDCNDLQ
jgi:membrane-associated phospholipid phosphatase